MPVRPRRSESSAPGRAFTSMTRGLVLSQDLFDQIIRHLRDSLPFEGCGLLAIPTEDHEHRIGAAFFPGTNVDRSTTRYTMDPAEVLAAFKAMRRDGLMLGAIVHSHPGSPATPSETDLAEAYYPDALLLIVSFAASEPDVRVWKLQSGIMREVTLILT